MEDSAEQVLVDWVRHDHMQSRYSDRDLVRAFADENAPTFEFLIENGQWGYNSLVWQPDARILDLARASGLTVTDWQDVILVNRIGRRFWNEADSRYDFFAAAAADADEDSFTALRHPSSPFRRQSGSSRES